MQRHVGHATGPCCVHSSVTTCVPAFSSSPPTSWSISTNRTLTGLPADCSRGSPVSREARTLYGTVPARWTLHLAEWRIETVCMQGQLRHDDRTSWPNCCCCMIAGQDFDTNSASIPPIVMTRSCVGAGQSSPSTASCARSRHSRRRPVYKPTPEFLLMTDPTPHPCLDVRRCCRAGCLQEAEQQTPPPPEVGVIAAQAADRSRAAAARAGRPACRPQRRHESAHDVPRTRRRAAQARLPGRLAGQAGPRPCS